MYYFRVAGHKVHFIAPCGQEDPFFDPPVEKVGFCPAGGN